MSMNNPVVLRLLDRMLQASQENAETLAGAMQRVTRELASLSYSYNGHMLRAGMRSAALQALDWQLEAASTVLSRTLFDLQQRLLGDVQTLRTLLGEFEAVNPVDDRTVGERLGEGLDAYCVALEREYRGISETMGSLTMRLRLMANNIEIAACQTDSAGASASVDLFCAMSALLRGLAGRLRNTTGDLQIFERTQNGHAESLRAALASGEEGEAA